MEDLIHHGSQPIQWGCKHFPTISTMFHIKQLPRLWNYWSPDIRYDDPYISSIMSKTRYLKISQYLYLAAFANAHPSKNTMQTTIPCIKYALLFIYFVMDIKLFICLG